MGEKIPIPRPTGAGLFGPQTHVAAFRYSSDGVIETRCGNQFREALAKNGGKMLTGIRSHPDFRFKSSEFIDAEGERQKIKKTNQSDARRH